MELTPATACTQSCENPDYLRTQLITCIGNKRNLLSLIGQAIAQVIARRGTCSGTGLLKCLDLFSGSGVVARFLKQYSSLVIANDIERYSAIINSCYLTNVKDFDNIRFGSMLADIVRTLDTQALRSGFIADMYAPQCDEDIRQGERAFYTRRNAQYLDTARQLIGETPPEFHPYFLGPLLAEASVHANTAGVFKGFYKDREKNVGQFGGKNKDALGRILGHICLAAPVLSNFCCEHQVHNRDANQLCLELPEVDLAYLDPPYNQHPYGSNYFMLNMIADYKKPELVSASSGIPAHWQRSLYNKKSQSLTTFSELISRVRAAFILVSFNSEGFISLAQMMDLLSAHGSVTVFESRYNAFRGSRNFTNRPLHVKEFLFLLERH